jgi:hypothetical protein
MGKDSFVIVEKWSGVAELKAHARAPHMAAYAVQVKNHVRSERCIFFRRLETKGNAHDTIVTLKRNPLRWQRHVLAKCQQIRGVCDIRTRRKELMKGWIAGKAKIEEATLLC